MIDPDLIRKVVSITDPAVSASLYTRLTRHDDGTCTGRCPVHGGAMATFSVEPSKGVCGCSVCSRAWGVIDLVKTLEHTDIEGASRLLARRAGITIPETIPEATADSMFEANERAARFFAQQLTGTDDGRAIGLSYFHQRGISDEMIGVFGLGYSPDSRNAAHTVLTSEGFAPDLLAATGLSGKSDHGDYYDRYRGRVIFPVHTVSGRVVAFGARTLRSDKDIAKYVNSPESEIYSKSRELYGLYQARESIVAKGYAILVEGYMDVISMFQAGVRNVVASSGTSLTAGQVELLRRFTDRVIVIYDADAAGIKAAVRSIDMLLSAGLEMSTVSLPPGEDPDSFARSHTPEETEHYLASHSVNMVDFRLSLLPPQVMRDPVERTRAIGSIIDSIALIDDDNRRRMLIETCRNRPELRLSEKAIVAQVGKRILENASRRAEARKQQQIARGIDGIEADIQNLNDSEAARRAYLRPYELGVVKYAVKYGIMQIPDASNYTQEGELTPMTAVELIDAELKADEMVLSNEDLRHTLECAVAIFADKDVVEDAYRHYEAEAASDGEHMMAERAARLEQEVSDLGKLEALEKKLSEEVGERVRERFSELCARHVASEFLVSPDDSLRRIAAESLYSAHKISAIYTRTASIEREDERLVDKIMLQVYCLKYATVLWQIKETHDAIRQAGDDFEAISSYMLESKRLGEVKMLLARTVGDRVIAPPL